MRRPGVGWARRTGARGIGGGAPAPGAPTISGTVTIGGTLTIVAGTGPAPASYTLYRDGVSAGTVVDGYTYVAADIGPTLTVKAVAGGTSPASNSLAFDDVVYFNSEGARAIYDAADVTLSGSDIATVTDRSGHNNTLVVVVGTAPLFIASDAGFNDQPAIQHDGGTEYLRETAFDVGASVAALGMFAVLRVDSATTNDRWASYGTSIFLRQGAGPVAQMATSGTGSATSTCTTVMTGAHLVGGDWVGVAGNVRAFMDGVAEDTDANTKAAVADDSSMTIGADSAGANTAAITWAYILILDRAISADCLAHLNAYCEHRFGVT